MTNISHNLSGKIDNKTVAISSEIDQAAGNLKLPYFIVGAMERDILLQHAHNIHTTRATLDTDTGVFVTDGDQFEKLKNALVHTGKFRASRQRQRLIYDKEENSDYVRASAHLLGREMAKIAATETKAALINILEREADASEDHGIAMDILRQDML